MFLKMTGTYWKHRVIIPLMWGCSVFVIPFLLSFVIESLSKLPRTAAIVAGFTLFWLPVLFLFLGNWIYSSRTSGRVLKDCGPHPMRWYFLLTAAMFLFVGLTGGPNLGRMTEASTMAVLTLSFTIMLTLLMVVMSLGRLQICEGGIWQYWWLLPWRKIDSFIWADDSTLRLKAKTHIPLPGRGAMPVAEVDRESVDLLLKKYCGVTEEV